MVDTYVSGAYGEICVGSSPISDIKKRITIVILFLICSSGVGFNPYITGSSGFADGRHEVSPDSEEIERS